MSRSYKKAIIKDGGARRRGYNSTKKSKDSYSRSKINQEVREGKFENLSLTKELVNDYDFCDYKYKIEYKNPECYINNAIRRGLSPEEVYKEDLRKARRK